MFLAVRSLALVDIETWNELLNVVGTKRSEAKIKRIPLENNNKLLIYRKIVNTVRSPLFYIVK
ncbi:MAG: hypothetical protein HC941_31365 [Microcoleus sp. SU_5_3]|nr:hypothetical protein [Microcoleus sp. SU_5_3]